MRLESEQLQLSAGDLANHLGCRHLTRLSVQVATGQIAPPGRSSGQLEQLESLQRRGLEHEKAYLESLRRESHGQSVVDLTDQWGSEATLAAMRDGVDLIVQAGLSEGRWNGRADILRRISCPSDLGDWSYEVVDTKLARQTRAGTILQLCLYSEMVDHLQGRLADRMHVVSPGTDDGEPFIETAYRVRDYMAYYRLACRRLEEAVDDHDPADTYPEPVPQCEICQWWSDCDRRRHDDDHLSLVAGMSALQRHEVESWPLTTLAEFAVEPLPLRRRPAHGAAASYEQLREQARVQLEGRQRQQPCYELLDREPDRGLARLPSPSPGDVFFDIEGDRFVGNSGLEYLFGWATVGPSDAVEYDHRWAVSGQIGLSGQEALEKALFEEFVDMVMVRWREHPDLHIYHFAPYEPVALKRLMGRYATRGNEIDRMLRANLFVDLHSVTRQAVRAGVESYSIKSLEQFYGLSRDVDLVEAGRNLREIENWLETGDDPGDLALVQAAVLRYNRDDCLSTFELRNWLEKLRSRLVDGGEEVPRPPSQEEQAEAEPTEREREVQALIDRLVDGVASDSAERSAAQQGQWLLAQALGWHQREAKSQWWEYFRLAELDYDDLREERAGVTGLSFLGEVGEEPGAGLPIHHYLWSGNQEIQAKPGQTACEQGGARLGTVAGFDPATRTISIKKRRDAIASHPAALYVFDEPITSKSHEDSLKNLATWIAGNGIDDPGQYRAARDLLLRRRPRHSGGPSGKKSLVAPGESVLDAARRLVGELDGGVLAVQGPPGSGKTFTGGRMICELVRAGKTVGITATSHKVISNFLRAVQHGADEYGMTVNCVQKGSSIGDAEPINSVTPVDTNQKVLSALKSGAAAVAAGTTWVWTREEFRSAVDVLFVDEAGQMSLANVLAIAPAAESVVLLGDPQQLEQPQQGAHPEGMDVSALEHLLGESLTMPDDRGLFLGETWRLHPTICSFTSELFYEGRLNPREDLECQALHGSGRFDGSGLWFLPLDHQGNQSASAEEADLVAEIYAELLTAGAGWTDREGVRREMTTEDVLIVVPYNAHLFEIARRLPGARVGTVDRFQGQEAPVVIYSMATSAPEDAPRGMEFLYSLNRLNVATSRARCVNILVANPGLLEPECRSPRQMQLANAHCRYRELAAVPRAANGQK